MISLSSAVKAILIFILVGLCEIILLVLGYGIFFRAVYPIRYVKIVNDVSKLYNVEPEMIYAIIKVESDFNEIAESRSGAYGLMQIMPDTFEWLQLFTKEEKMDPEHLKNPDINIQYGTFFISELRKRYGSDELILSAYNAGISKVDKWLKDENISNGGEELTIIPYKETREYVRRVLESKDMYYRIYFKK